MSSSIPDAIIARNLNINGIVQGVGFRPHVYQQARRFQLTGHISNTSSGVCIHIEGSAESLSRFRQSLSETLPPLACILDITESSDTVQGFPDFSIIQSRSDRHPFTLISPDVSVCEDCLKEMRDPADRRYGYPFINCTNCGPRYTIIEDIPYDRPFTSMKHFTMCRECQAEYDDPANRRFHAQPNACPVCGPKTSLCDANGYPVVCENPVTQAAQLLRQGHIVAVKGLGGFHLAVDALNAQAVMRLRTRKHREEKPLAIMVAGIADITPYAFVTPEEQTLLTSFHKPVVLLKKKTPCLLPEAVSPCNAWVGVMIAYTPLHYLLLARGPAVLVMTSANLSEEPIAIDNADALKRLSGIADYFLLHNRDILLRGDDSVLRHAAGGVRMIRRSRGFTPVPVLLRQKTPPVLACGGELKNTVCLTRGNQAFLSQHIGDLENMASYDFYRMTIEHLKRILGITPEIVAFDLHPDYFSTRYAQEQSDVLCIPVQHHHAHIVSCMAENRIDGPVIGMAFDGAGYGEDGAIWGGELLIADECSYRRAGHLAYMPLPGGAAAVREPWRMALAYLDAVYGESMMDLSLPVIRDIRTDRLQFIRSMIAKNVNCPKTSSMGRLFDAIAAIAGIRYKTSYEGQAAIELEMVADSASTDVYPFEWTSDDGYRIQPHPLIRAVVADIQGQTPLSTVSARFHNTVIRMMAELCRKIRNDIGLNRVALSGGVFQNVTLLTGLIQTLSEDGFHVFSHSLVPANDGGLALGQAVSAAMRMQKHKKV